MRSSILIASALAMGALAGPIDVRAYKTVTASVDTVEVEVQVKVDRNGNPYATTIVTTRPYGGVHAHNAKPTTPCSISKAFVKKPVSSRRPRPSSPSKSSKSKPAPTTKQIVSSATTTTQESVPPAPTTTQTVVPPAPTTSKTAQAPSSTPSSAPSSAPSAPQFGVTHKSGEQQATFQSGVDYQNAVLWHHNRARANHGASPLQWSEECVAGAMKAAQTCVFEHLTTEGQGQNLYATSGDAANVTSGITESFYKAEADIYGQAGFWGKEPDMSDFHSWGHLTQVVWKGTTHVGCVTLDCPSMTTSKYTVCNYSPPGNYAGQYGKNVEAPKESYQGYRWLD